MRSHLHLTSVRFLAEVFYCLFSGRPPGRLRHFCMKSKQLLPLAVLGIAGIAAAQDTAPSPAPKPAPTTAPEEEATDTIEVTSTRLPRDVSQSVTAVTVITQKQIAAQKPFDLAEVLNRAPGLSVA